MNYIEHLFINFKYQNKSDNFVAFYSTLAKEIEAIKHKYQFKLKSIYIATNDVLLFSNQQLEALLTLVTQFSFSNLIEYSFEIGYQTLNPDQLAILKQFKINRLVWRVRTFNQTLLLSLNKKFNIDQMKELIKHSFDFQYQNFSIDLEDNISNQTKNDILNDIQTALSLNAAHISYQSHSDQHNQQNKKIIFEFLTQNNYHNYEFFSFALKEENYSQQTLAYLTLKNWYGIGPTAGSFLKFNNQILTISNTNNVPWIKTITKLDNYSYFQLLLTQNLMLQKGILLKNDFLILSKPFAKSITNLINKGYLQVENDYLKATNQGWNLLNEVLIDIINIKN